MLWLWVLRSGWRRAAQWRRMGGLTGGAGGVWGGSCAGGWMKHRQGTGRWGAVMWHARAERHAAGYWRQFVQCIGGVWVAQGEAGLLAGVARGCGAGAALCGAKTRAWALRECGGAALGEQRGAGEIWAQQGRCMCGAEWKLEWRYCGAVAAQCAACMRHVGAAFVGTRRVHGHWG